MQPLSFDAVVSGALEGSGLYREGAGYLRVRGIRLVDQRVPSPPVHTSPNQRLILP